MSEGGAHLADIIGFPIDLGSGKVLASGDTVEISAPASAQDVADALHDRLGGRFILHVRASGENRLYLDCAGQVPCVFDPEARVAAASPYAIVGEDYDARFDKGLYDRMGVGRSGWLPAGLTAHHGVHRLLPNHYLDLETFEVHRHWPLEDIEPADDPEAEVDALIAVVRQQLDALLASPKKVAQALTAGRETRMLLGCARPYLDHIDFVTVGGSDRFAVDTVMSRKIAARFGLSHRFLDTVTASDAARETYLRLNGHCVADGNANTFPSVHPIADSHVFVGGAGGEVGRGFFWHTDDTPETKLTGASLVRRMGLHPEEALIAAMDGWLDEMPLTNTLRIFDFAYIEQRMGPWASAQFVSDPTLVRLAPLMTRQGVVNMLRLPDAWKRGEGMAEALLARTWPELDDLPYNTLGKAADAFVKLRRIIDDPSLVIRKFRKSS